ncbi:hypothetical protein KUM42_19215 [Modestobacter sp. L9-4]|uniref:hypothetical protein n=1 Tax=Modestobacter sp. L9-4 TaxID=2851567 RepID=UPI001C748DB7|nr:hypothetical protein [Modestobacter sp. L9-4]QXG75869.1 hypothetical protein KUM42_19215 [Modestobacter sp. L9-4]
MSDTDGTDTGPVEERTRRSGRPPVPAPVPSEQADGQHRTERVPFPLPPLHGDQQPGERPAAPRTEQLPAQPAPGAPGRQPAAAPETGQLQLGGYPPRVPGASRPRPATDDPAPDGPVEDDGDGR